MRLVNWYLGLTIGQKVVVGTAAFVLVISFTYLASIVILLAAGVGPEQPQEGGTPTPASPVPSTSASASAPSESAVLEIQEARWEGDQAFVEGTWQGDLSSVHCDLLEGSRSGQAIDWWDRSLAAKTSLSGRTFSQAFIRDGGEVKDPIDPNAEYWATCWGQFSDGLATGDDAPVKGTPPGG